MRQPNRIALFVCVSCFTLSLVLLLGLKPFLPGVVVGLVCFALVLWRGK
jgi:hypothetical protein